MSNPTAFSTLDQQLFNTIVNTTKQTQSRTLDIDLQPFLDQGYTLDEIHQSLATINHMAASQKDMKH